MREPRILVVEDDRAFREALGDTLELAGYRVSCAADGHQALAQLERQRVDLVLSDVKMAPMDGPTLLEQIKRRFPDLPVVLMTAYGTIAQAVAAIQAGAGDYLVKPFTAEVLLEKVRRHLVSLSGDELEAVVDPASRKVYALARQVAPTDVNVLILGESGTGKEVLARYLHRHSGRGAFVAINCAAIPDALLEAELFGYEKGAFTGAVKANPGKFELAQGGTLLLDEVSEMHPLLQAKLLRVLQEREVERIGGRRAVKLDVRVIATSNRDLRAEVAAGRFREDLYYRLNVFPLYLPPLRECLQDLEPLVRTLLARHAGGRTVRLSADAWRKLKSYSWPGNVRELENVLRRALILCPGEWIEPEALIFDQAPEGVERSSLEVAPHPSVGTARLEQGLRSVEEQIILTTLKEERGSRTATAKRLGISPRTLRYKLAKMRAAGIPVPC